jgi:hypothetical protein
VELVKKDAQADMQKNGDEDEERESAKDFFLLRVHFFGLR